MLPFLSKKNPLPALGLITDFVFGVLVKVRPLATPVLAVDNNDSGEYENKANKVVNSDHF